MFLLSIDLIDINVDIMSSINTICILAYDLNLKYMSQGRFHYGLAYNNYMLECLIVVGYVYTPEFGK